MEGFNGKKVYINDPAYGRRIITEEDLDNCFTGVVLTFEKKDTFKKTPKPHHLRDFIINKITKQKEALLALLCLGAILIIPGLIIPILGQLFMDKVLIAHNLSWATTLIIAIAFITLAQNALVLYRNFMQEKLNQKVSLMSTHSFFRHLFSLPMNFYDQRSIGDLVGRSENNDNVNQFLMGNVTSAVLDLFTAVFYLVILFFYSPVLLLIGIVGLVVNIFFARYSAKIMAAAAEKQQVDGGKLSGIVFAGFSIGNNQIKIIKSDSASNLHISCYNLLTKALIWKSKVDEVPKRFLSSDECWIIPWADNFIICIDTMMYSINSDDGTVRTSVTLYDKIIDMYTWPDGLFSFVLANGYYAIGWESIYGFYDSKFVGATLDLHDTALSISYNNGPLHAIMSDGRIEDIHTVSLAEGGGSIVCVDNEKCVAYVVTALPQLQKSKATQIFTSQHLPQSIGNFIDATNDGFILMGPVRLPDGYGVLLIDANTHTADIVAIDDRTALGSRLLLTADGKEILAQNIINGDMKYFDLNGGDFVLSEAKNAILSTYNGTNYVGTQNCSDMARQKSTGEVISANCDGDFITVWVDAQENDKISIPDTICWAIHDDLRFSRMFCVGENGLFILSDYQSYGEDKVSNFAIYDLNNKCWKIMEDVAHGSSKRMLSSGKATSLFAVYDEDMNIRVYNPTLSKSPVCINTELSIASIQKLEFCLDDRYIMVGTQDGRCIIYSIADGNIVFKYNYGKTTSEDDFSLWYDNANRRMYIRIDYMIISVDTRSWEILFSLDQTDNAVLYSEAQNEIYFKSTNWDTAESILDTYPVPSTAELINIALQVQQE